MTWVSAVWTRPAVIEIGEWLLTVLLAQLTLMLLIPATNPFSHKALSIAGCVAMIIVGLLCRCARATSPVPEAFAVVTWSLAMAAGACLLIVINNPGPLDAVHMISMGTATFVLAVAIAALHQRLHSQRNNNKYTSRGYTFTAAVVLVTLMPLWLGPWLDWLAAGELTVNAIVAASPLSYLAVMADYDYLRSEWFYQHTPVGMLRYDYLPKLAYSGGWLLLALAALAVPRVSAWVRNAFNFYVLHKARH